MDQLLARDELEKCGLYVLVGADPVTNQASAYIGEAENIRERLTQHRTRDWVSAIVFVSKDENLTKAHVFLAAVPRIHRILHAISGPSIARVGQSGHVVVG